MSAPAVGERRQLAGVPLLVVRPPGRSPPLPTVLWFHGLGADKEVHLPELQRFAAAGLLAVGVDAVGHGERRLPDLDTRFAGSPQRDLRLFASLVEQTVAELPQLIDALVADGLCDQRRLGVAGVSMGGCIVYGAIAADCRIRAAVALLGAPLAPGASAAAGGSAMPAVGDRLPTALLSIGAENDDVVPPAAARALHAQLLARYRDCPARLDYRLLAGAPHFMDADDWDDALAQAGEWLGRHLA